MKSNKLIPVLGLVLLAIVGTILYQQFSGSKPVKPGVPLTQVPSALPKTKPSADADNASETLKQVTASNTLLRERVEQVINDNEKLKNENARLSRGRSQPADPGLSGNGSTQASPSGTFGTSGVTGSGTSAAGKPAAHSDSTLDVFSDALSNATDAARGVINNSPLRGSRDGTGGAAAGSSSNAGSNASSASTATDDGPDGTVRYKLMAPMGYAAQTTKPTANGGVPMTRFVRTSHSDYDASGYAGPGPASRAAQQAAIAPSKPQATPYFTIPENATLAGVTAMSSIIGRVPIDGRVTDPMQFKAIVGRDNLAANGFEMPDDLAGMIVTGIAIGDMALSCSEGKVRSITFVFNDGSIRTVSTRRNRSPTNSGSTIAGAGTDLGFISDEHGNPCIPGQFVTNAGSYLTDIVAAKTLGVAAKAYAEAERTVSSNLVGGYTSAVTGSKNSFALGSAAAGASDELTAWLLSRLKNSFDAVVTPAGQKLAVHLDQEIQLDKAINARKLIYRTQDEQLARGARHGLE